MKMCIRDRPQTERVRLCLGSLYIYIVVNNFYHINSIGTVSYTHLDVYKRQGLQGEAAEFGAFIADQGAEQCGFCNPGFMMNAIALFREKSDPTDEEIKEYLAGNLCRCSGYEGQLRGIRAYLDWKKQREEDAQ